MRTEPQSDGPALTAACVLLVALTALAWTPKPVSTDPLVRMPGTQPGILTLEDPATCMNCHASTYVTMKKLGNGDLVKGFEALNQMPYVEARKQVEHPVACIDCHDPATGRLKADHPELASLAIDAITTWKFEPPLCRRQPVLVRAQQVFKFEPDKPQP